MENRKHIKTFVITKNTKLQYIINTIISIMNRWNLNKGLILSIYQKDFYEDEIILMEGGKT